MAQNKPKFIKKWQPKEGAWEYATEKKEIQLKEYGRFVQELAEHTMRIEDREDRSKKAYSLVELMRHLNPAMKDGEDYDHALWDHLYYLTNFFLDVDGAYPMPEINIRRTRPKAIDYPGYVSTYRNYGQNLENMIEMVSEIEEEQKRMGAVNYVGKLMKAYHHAWTKEFIDDQIILEQMVNISEGKLKDTIDKMKEENLLDLYVKIHGGGNSSSNSKSKRRRRN